MTTRLKPMVSATVLRRQVSMSPLAHKGARVAGADQPLQFANLCLLTGYRGSLFGELCFLSLRDGLLLPDECALSGDLRLSLLDLCLLFFDGVDQQDAYTVIFHAFDLTTVVAEGE